MPFFLRRRDLIFLSIHLSDHCNMTRLSVLTITAVAVAAATPAFSSASNTSTTCNHALRPTATIDTGVVAGTITAVPLSDVNVTMYLGIPFAQRPVRFLPPRPALAWESIYDASEYKPSCHQMFRGTGEEREQRIRQFNTPPPSAGESEDCLNLNIYAPADAEPGSKAVLFWIYGGAFDFGANSLPLYDGAGLAAHENVVLVTINYRINLFGFPGSPELAIGAKNLGFLDQRLALDWVRRNIAVFGGDPDRITLFGESAGATSIDALLTAPPNPLPFQAAILQSSQSSVMLSTHNGSINAWLRLVEHFDCACDDALNCMRAVPARELVEAAGILDLAFEPESDGGITYADNLRERRLNSDEAPEVFARVPVLVGTNSGEGRFANLRNLTIDDVLATVGGGVDLPQELVEAIHALYAIGTPGIENEYDQVATLLTEFVAQCPMRFFSDDSVSVGIDTWRYFFDASFSNSEIFPGSGAYHSAEIQLVFGTYQQENATEYQREVSRAMQKAWADFAKDPSAGPGWDQVPNVAVIGGGVRAGDDVPEGLGVIMSVDADVVDARCALFAPIYNASI
ncbi:hypothetical protein S7711_05498 [Stachybotrys chartarum IBT 7711]|uniref:Carboxylic ester hydrolase n=1 Tax=Stachybotrys chartarum (strain CBS 109288 / IBT 7711) TaxID=1280523 RepID=A0A084AS06_STACB|nr:hypothetical protein S7711_05498 [Stachybotrys chartarum IBT 7711]KFA76020.1 hypothetical protein S40288_00339 [Stachybotrys chartarum IBT 40288]